MHYSRTTTTVRAEDAEFIQKHNLSVAELVRQRCAQLRADETAKLELAHAQRTIEARVRDIKTVYRYLGEIGKFEEFVKWEREKNAQMAPK